MKKIIYLFAFLSCFAVISCDESLTEVPKDFSSPENSFTNKANFESALANIYLTFRTQMYVGDGDSYTSFDMMGVDVDFGDNKLNNTTLKPAS